MQAKATLEESLKVGSGSSVSVDPDPRETAEWLEAWNQILSEDQPERAAYLLKLLSDLARAQGVKIPIHFNTPYCNTISPDEEVPYPGNLEIERRIKSIIRWNAMAMVVGQNKKDAGIGGHIATYASVATLPTV